MSEHFRQSGWRCIGIEPNPKFAALHREAGNEVYEYAAGDHDADDQDFDVVEAGGTYSPWSFTAHSYSSLAVKPEYRDFNNGAMRHFRQTSIKVRIRTLDHILRLHCPNLHVIDLLSVDVEGYELEVMRGFSPHRYEVRAIVLENLFHSASYSEYMTSIGYRLHSRVRYNYVYVRE